MCSPRKFLVGFVTGLFATLACHAALAQLGTKVPRIVVAFPAGGATDLIARLIAEELKGRYAPSVIVENRPGASGRVGTEYVKNAEPDGSIMLYTPDFPMTLIPHAYKRVNYNPLTDFVAVATCTASITVVSAGPALPASVRTVPELVQWLKANPKSALYGSASPGSAQHFVGVMLARAAGIEMTHVSYKGGAAAAQDLLGGQIPISINPLAEILPHVKAGKLRIIASAKPARSPFLPDVPTLVESGYKDVYLRGWSAIFVPAKTPREIVVKLHNAVNDALKSESITKALPTLTYEAFPSQLAEVSSILREDHQKWGGIVKASGFSADD
jgi:tripartite-type tricarboxylate transporter receptor subunit TctC